MDNEITRRDFVRLSACGLTLAAPAPAAPAPAPAAGAMAPGQVPRRPLGKTGVSVPILGFGSASAGVRRDVKNATALHHEAISLGVNYFDAATLETGYGIAHKQLGSWMKERRKEIFLTTKCLHSSSDGLMRILEANLKELQTDHVDLLYMHSLGAEPAMALKDILRKGGAYEGLLKAKREGLTRFIGVTGHHRPMKFVQLLKARQLDVMMNAVNPVDRHTYGFEEKVWPLAAKKNVGLVAMKVFGGAVSMKMSNSKLDQEHHDMAFRYALSQPGVACAVIGMATREELLQNVERAKRFKPLSETEMAQILSVGKELASNWGAHYGAVA